MEKYKFQCMSQPIRRRRMKYNGIKRRKILPPDHQCRLQFDCPAPVTCWNNSRHKVFSIRHIFIPTVVIWDTFCVCVCYWYCMATQVERYWHILSRFNAWRIPDKLKLSSPWNGKRPKAQWNISMLERTVSPTIHDRMSILVEAFVPFI